METPARCCRVAHETVTAHHGNDYLPLAERFCRASRPALFGVLDVLVLRSASADTSLLDAIRFLRASSGRTGEYIPAHEDAASGMPRLMYRITGHYHDDCAGSAVGRRTLMIVWC